MIFKYSVIIPHYNDSRRLERLLISIPLQRNDIQILVIDDCSPNQIELNNLKKKWNSILFLSTKRNSGAGTARNIGLENATGKYILFADADDEFIRGAFDIFDEKLNKDIDIFYFIAKAWQEASNQPSVRADSLNSLCFNYIHSPNDYFLLKLKLYHCVPWAKVYSKKFLDSTGIKFDQTFVSNDVYFNIMNALLSKKIKVFNDYVYKVYRLTDSLTSTLTAERLIERVKVSAKIASAQKKLGIKEKRSATGYILTSISYGIPTFLSVLFLSMKSDMSINLFRILEIERWTIFFKRKSLLKKETNKNKI